MNGANKPLVRAAGLILLVTLSVVALRASLPAAPTAAKPPEAVPKSHSIGLQLLILGTVAIVMLMSIRRRRTRQRPPAEESPSYLRSDGLNRREVLVAALGMLALVVLTWAVIYLIRPSQNAPTPQQPEQTTQSKPPDDTQRRPIDRKDGSDRSMLILGAVLLGMTVMVLVLRRRNPDAAVDDASPAATPEATGTTPGSLAQAVELALAEVAEPGRDPRASIIACYAAMEQGLTDAPDAAPLASDTPSEVLQRAVHIGALHSDAGTQLVSLFSEARFSPHQMTQADRESAARWLQTVLDDLRSRR